MLLALIVTSCIIQAPKYTGIQEVFTLKPGMHRDTVSKVLGIEPYDIKLITDSITEIIYKYRTTDRKTIPFFMNKTNGIKAKGKWGNLLITYDASDTVLKIEACPSCGKTFISEKKFDYTPIITTISSISLPAILIYLGIKL